MKEKKKIKAIPPTLREKHRYILVVFNDTNKEKQIGEFNKELTKELIKLSGAIGLSRANPRVIKLSKKFAIIRCNRESTAILKISLVILKKYKIKRILYCSGSLRKITKKIEEFKERGLL